MFTCNAETTQVVWELALFLYGKLSLKQLYCNKIQKMHLY